MKDSDLDAGVVAGRLAQQLIELGLTWSEAVAVLGLAAKAVAQAAATASGEDPRRYAEKGRRQLIGAFDHEVRVVVAAPDSEREEPDHGNPLLKAASRRIRKLH